jgi:hypothetical protein
MTDLPLTRLCCRLWRLVADHVPWLNAKPYPAPNVEILQDGPQLSWFSRERDCALWFYFDEEHNDKLAMGLLTANNSMTTLEPTDEQIVAALWLLFPEPT